VTAPVRVTVELGDRSYPVLVGKGALGDVARIAAEASGGGRVFVLADANVTASWAGMLRESLAACGARTVLHELPAGETAKSLDTVEVVARALVKGAIERGDIVAGIGGGAATDVAGFVAAITLRGVRWASFPTTLLGQVDAAVGGKTGVNLPEGKNLVGAFHQPIAVACDPAPLSTLPARELRAGFAEVVKTAWIGDPALIERLESSGLPAADDAAALADVVARCVAVKARIVSEDEREGGRRAVLNFGHTIGHAIESTRAPHWRHGEAVSLGLVAALHLSVHTGTCEAGLLERMIAVLERLDLPTRDPGLEPDAVLHRTRTDKKRSGGADRYQLTAGIGLVSVAPDVPEGAVRAAIEFLRR
jgi:3-dehydroquinate synthase